MTEFLFAPNACKRNVQTVTTRQRHSTEYLYVRTHARLANHLSVHHQRPHHLLFPLFSAVKHLLNEKSAQRDANTARAGCSKAERPALTFPGAQDGQDLISWR